MTAGGLPELSVGNNALGRLRGLELAHGRAELTAADALAEGSR